MAIEAAARVHIGGRSNQEDGATCLVSPRGTIALLAAIDGMGGPDRGEYATGVTRSHLTRLAGQRPTVGKLCAELLAADVNIRADSDAKGIHESNLPGCVVTAAWINQRTGNLIIAHIGDTRCYMMVPRQSWIQVTTDHTLVQQDHPRFTESERMMCTYNSIITRHVGRGSDKIEFYEPTCPDTYALLLCSDGLHDVVHEDIINMVMYGLWTKKTYDQVLLESERVTEIHRELNIADNVLVLKVIEILLRARKGGRTCAQVASDLIELSLLYQPHLKADNVTVVVARVTPTTTVVAKIVP